VKYGHAGSGHFVEKEVLVRARSVPEAMRKAKHFPGVKKGYQFRTAASVLQVVRAA
jgi:hypothetical protein